MGFYAAALAPGNWSGWAGRMFLGGLSLGILGWFALSLLRFRTRKSTLWMAQAVVSGMISAVVVISLAGAGWASLKSPVPKDGEVRELVALAHDQVISPRDGSVSLETPMSWVEMPAVHPDAKLCVGRKRAEQYVLVMPTLKAGYAGTLADYDQELTAAMDQKLKEAVISAPEAVRVGDFPALRRRLEGRIDQLEVVYYALHVETKEAFYEILAWTPKEHDEAAAPVLRKVMESFRVKEDGPEHGG